MRSSMSIRWRRGAAAAAAAVGLVLLLAGRARADQVDQLLQQLRTSADGSRHTVELVVHR